MIRRLFLLAIFMILSVSQAGSTTAASLVFSSPIRYAKFCIGPTGICSNISVRHLWKATRHYFGSQKWVSSQVLFGELADLSKVRHIRCTLVDWRFEYERKPSNRVRVKYGPEPLFADVTHANVFMPIAP